MTLRVRIALLAAAVVTVAVAAVGWSAVRSARAELTEEVDNDLLARAALVFAERRPGFWSGGPQWRERDIGSLLSDDPLGSLVSLDAHARVVRADLDATGGVIRSGELIFALNDDIGTVPDAGRLERARRARLVLDTVQTRGRQLRLMTVAAGEGVFVQVARPLDEVENAVAGLRRQVLLFGTLAVAAAAAGAWFLAGRTVRPIVKLTETAEQIAETGDVNRAVEDSGAGEVGRLARSFRTMLAALSTSRRQQHRLVIDASHELRTPLTSLRTNVDLLRRADELSPEDRSAALADVDAELNELTDLVTELVDLAADVRTDEEPQLIVLSELVEPVVQRARRRSGRDIVVRADRRVPVEGHPEALIRAVRNLVDNAVKFSEGGPIEVVADGGSVTVHDAGQGVPKADRDRIFERFHRLEADRDRPGSGLGLAIVRQVAEAHGGTATVGTSPLGGAAFSLRIPEIDE
jgi:signal transduction histidine kinase